MAKSEGTIGLAALAFGLGIATGAAMMTGSAERRGASIERIRVGLAERAFKLVTADLGRTPQGPAWVVTVEFPDRRVATANVQLLATQDPHDPVVCAEVVRRIVEELPRAIGG